MNKTYEEVSRYTVLNMTKTYEEIDAFDAFCLDIRIMERRGSNPHCEDGVACTLCRREGSLRGRAWFRDGLRHRDDGPADEDYHKGRVFPGDTRTFEELKRAGAVMMKAWWINGRKQEPE